MIPSDNDSVRALRKIVKPGSTAIDVGANIGYYSLLLAKWGASVHSFEPFPATVRRFRRNAELNPKLRVSVNELALSDHVDRGQPHHASAVQQNRR